MPRQRVDKEQRSFVGGLITEAGPLTFPENASLVDKNFELLPDGSRRRRLGLDYLPLATTKTINQTLPSDTRVGCSSFLWENAGGIPGVDVYVIQVGAAIHFYTFASGEFTQVGTSISSVVGVKESYQYAAIDDYLVIATNQADVTIINFDGTSITKSTRRLKIRDLFGVEDRNTDGADLLDYSYLQVRPSILSDAHVYNLRNQTWGKHFLAGSDGVSTDVKVDPVQQFSLLAENNEPGNQYNVTLALEGGTWRVRIPDAGLTFADFNKNTNYYENMTGAFSRTVQAALIEDTGALDYTGDGGLEAVTAGDIISWNGTDYTLVVESGETTNDAFPSNADSAIPFLFPDASASGVSATVDRFHSQDAADSSPPSSRAPTGYFVIDALERGTSRLEEYANNQLKFNALLFDITALPEDKTPGGITCVEEYAGRVFYGGFSPDIVDGDNQSPRLSSYVLFSRLVRNQEDITRCFQESDPTSIETPDLIDTDGGFIRIEGVRKIQRLIQVGSSLIVLADNGVWSIMGGSEYGFTATNYIVRKLTDRGVTGPETVVVARDVVFYWSDVGIYVLSPSENGMYYAQNMTDSTIKTLYKNIPEVEKATAKAIFDDYENKIRWLYNTAVDGTPAKELIYDIVLKAFNENEIASVGTSEYVPEDSLPAPIMYLEVEPYEVSEVTDAVTYNGEVVTYMGEPVTYSFERRQSGTREVLIVAISNVFPLINIRFCSFNNSSFLDWEAFDGVGIDAKAELITGWDGLGDFKRDKKINHLYMHMYKTEEGFTNEFEPINVSSCVTRVRWNWTNSPESYGWSRPFEAYRHRRVRLPANSSEDFHPGEYVVTTRNTLRGSGKVFALDIETSPLKDLHIIGWSLSIDSETVA